MADRQGSLPIRQVRRGSYPWSSRRIWHGQTPEPATFVSTMSVVIKVNDSLIWSVHVDSVHSCPWQCPWINQYKNCFNQPVPLPFGWKPQIQIWSCHSRPPASLSALDPLMWKGFCQCNLQLRFNYVKHDPLNHDQLPERSTNWIRFKEKLADWGNWQKTDTSFFALSPSCKFSSMHWLFEFCQWFDWHAFQFVGEPLGS